MSMYVIGIVTYNNIYYYKVSWLGKLLCSPSACSFSFPKKPSHPICLWSCLQNLYGSCCSILTSFQSSCLLRVDVVLLLRPSRFFPGFLEAELINLSGLVIIIISYYYFLLLERLFYLSFFAAAIYC